MANYNELSNRDKVILNVFTGIGIAGGIGAQFALGVSGIVFGGFFGAGGAMVGALIGNLVMWMLPPSDGASS